MPVSEGCQPERRRAGNSTLNRLELGAPELTRYHRIAWDGANVEALLSICS
jgi:hypothetical protein